MTAYPTPISRRQPKRSACIAWPRGWLSLTWEQASGWAKLNAQARDSHVVRVIAGSTTPNSRVGRFLRLRFLERLSEKERS
jgi:hypothetical protein